jgi:hypothetical protein
MRSLGDVPDVPPTPINLKTLSPADVRRALAEALRDAGEARGFELSPGPALVRKVVDWTHRIEVRAYSRYNVRGKSAGTEMGAVVVNRRLKQHERRRGYEASPGYMWALSGLNVHCDPIDPVRDGWRDAYCLPGRSWSTTGFPCLTGSKATTGSTDSGNWLTRTSRGRAAHWNCCLARVTRLRQ